MSVERNPHASPGNISKLTPELTPNTYAKHLRRALTQSTYAKHLRKHFSKNKHLRKALTQSTYAEYLRKTFTPDLTPKPRYEMSSPFMGFFSPLMRLVDHNP